MPEGLTMLAGVRVVELSNDIGAAFCGQQLSLLGATVIRLVDGEGFLATRDEAVPAGGGLSALEVVLDRLKARQELTGDVVAKRAAIAAAMEGADVLITDGGADYLRALGVHRDDTSKDGRLIHAHVSTFGVKGAYGDWVGGDLEAQAMSGVVGQIGKPGQAPVPMPYKAGLLHGGLQASGAVAAALYQQKRSGEGGFIDIGAAQALAVDVRNYTLLLRYYRLPLKRTPRRPPGSMGRYPCSIFPCKDGYITLLARDKAQWLKIIELMGNPAWASDPRYQDDLKNAMIYADELDALVTPWLMQYTRAELVEMGLANRFPIGALNKMNEVLENEQYLYRDFFETVTVDGKDYTVPGNPVKIEAAA
ncbi:CoA transferase [soil metagenome]